MLATICFFVFTARAEYHYFDDVRSGSDIVMKELRWPYWNSGYYNTWWSDGWTSSDGSSGYFYNGLALPGAGSANPVTTRQILNWSFWPISNNGLITPVYTSLQTFSTPTTAEGTICRAPGLWTGWRTNVWYRFVIRCWQPPDGTPHLGYAGTWFRDSYSGTWYHMATVQFPFAVTGIDGSSGFQENASGSTVPERTDFSGSYYHYNGAWHSSTNWHGYCHGLLMNVGLITNTVDGTNAAVYLDTCNNSSYAGAYTYTNGQSSPELHLVQPSSPPLDPIVVTNYSAAVYGNQLLVQWQVPPTSSPQFAYQINVYTNSGYTGAVVASAYDIAPEARQKLLTVTNAGTLYPQLIIIDLFNQTNAAVNITPTNASLNAASSVSGVVNGLDYAYYQSATYHTTDAYTNWSAMPNFAALTPVALGAVSGVDLTPRLRRNGYAFNYTGYIYAPSNGLYAFTLNSCDGSILYIDGQQVINGDGDQSASDKSSWMGLQAGLHALNVQYYFDVQPSSLFSDKFDTLTLFWEGPGISKTEVPVTAYYRVSGGGEPSVSLSSPTSGTISADASVPLSASVTANGNTINSVQFYVGDYYWGQVVGTPYTLNSIFWATNNNPVRARLVYNGSNSMDSAVNLVTTTNLTLAPWQYHQAFYHYEPNGASIQGSIYSLIGDGVNLLTRQVNGDCTLIAHLAGMNSATAPDGTTAGGEAGIILRKTTDMTPGYPLGLQNWVDFTALFGSAGGGTYFQDGTMNNGGGAYSSGNLGGQKWFKLVRSNGTNFTSFVSSDGNTWTPVWTNTLTDFGATIYAGVFSYDAPSANQNVTWAKFDHVSLTGNVVGAPGVSVSPGTANVIAGQNVTFSATPVGEPPFSYQWQFNGGNLAGATNAILTLTNVQPSEAGLYTVCMNDANTNDGFASATATLMTQPPASPGVAAILADNPAGYWRLNEVSGPTAYDSVNNHDGTGDGGVVFGVAGVTNTPFAGFGATELGVQFNGMDSDIAIPALNLNTNAVTISGWIKRNGTQPSFAGIVFCRSGATVSGLNFGTANELRYTWNNSSSTYNWNSGLVVPDDVWTFFALSISPTRAVMYMATNGVLYSATNNVANTVQSFAGTTYLGYDPNSSSRRINGTLDEVAIFNQTLNAAQVGQMLSASLSSSVPAAVSLLTPANGANFNAPATINLSATVTTNGHNIRNVQFFNGAALLDTSSNAPYSLTWSNVPVGNYTVFAQVNFDTTSSQDSVPALITVNPPLNAPQNLNVVAVASNEIGLGWFGNTNATGYIVSRNGAPVATVNGTSWTDVGLTANTTYSYSVTATSAWGNSPPSATNSATTLPTGRAGLSWDANGSNAGADDGSGSWGGGAINWWNGSAVVSWTDGSVATFGAGILGNNTVTLANDVTLGGIVFVGVNGGYTLAGGVGVGINLTNQAAFNCFANGTVSAVIKGTGGLLKVGTGTLSLGGANTHAGGTTISNGALQLVDGGSLRGNVTNNAALVFNNSSSINFSNVVSGHGSLAQVGSGTLYLLGANTYTGGTIISNGELSLGNGSNGSENVNALGAGILTVKAGGTFQLKNSAGGSTFNIANPVVLDGGDVLSVDNHEHLTGPVSVTGNGGTLSQYYDTKSLWIDGQLTGSGPLTVDNPNGGSYQPWTGVHFSNSANTYSGIIAVIGNSVTLDNAFALSNAILNVTSAGSSGPLQWGSGVTNIVLGGLSGSYSVDNGGNALSVGNNGSSTTYSGNLSGAGSLTKLGVGTFTLSGANDYTGATMVNGGTLRINGSLATASGVKVNSGGTLAGTGTIGGATTIASGGTLMAGTTNIGTLAINNTMTLNVGSTTVLRLSKNGGTITNDSISGLASVSYNGALTVSIITSEGHQLAAGDTFRLFYASGYSGSFASYNLPVLSAGLGWDTSGLANNGSIKVAVMSPPSLVGGMALGGGQFKLMFNGTSGQSYTILSSTNMALPLSNWMVLSGGTLGGGPVNYTNTAATNGMQFFIIRAP